MSRYTQLACKLNTIDIQNSIRRDYAHTINRTRGDLRRDDYEGHVHLVNTWEENKHQNTALIKAGGSWQPALEELFKMFPTHKQKKECCICHFGLASQQ